MSHHTRYDRIIAAIEDGGKEGMTTVQIGEILADLDNRGIGQSLRKMVRDGAVAVNTEGRAPVYSAA